MCNVKCITGVYVGSSGWTHKLMAETMKMNESTVEKIREKERQRVECKLWRM